ncbi:hypothetical protein PanWU01x14_008060 [Parasponia andersonii]|uniref:Uncharacterized protein n=1 Tax=Parasponia andersonii TaxID=3476 RepID=A0A2P5E482_PARAD|nr:hypothetical protein PanWU01x14_008060 [Parasponia andersonii]
MRHQRPPVITKTRMVILNHLLITINQNTPIAMEIISTLQINLLTPQISLLIQKIDHGGLIIGLENRPPLELPSENLPCFVSDLPLRPHRSPSVENVERPLAIPQQKASSIKPNPVLIIVNHLVPPVHNKIVILVPLPRYLESHIGKHSITVHPPQKLDLGMRQQKLPNQRKLRPETRHFGVEKGHVVEDFDPVKPTVVDFVLDRLQQVMIPNRVLARFGRRPGYQKDPGLIGSDKVGETRVPLQPLGPLLVPVGYLGSETVRLVRIGFLVLALVDEYLGDIEGSVVIAVGLGRRGGGVVLGLFEDPVRLAAAAGGIDVVPDFVEVLLRGAELAGADGAT